MARTARKQRKAPKVTGQPRIKGSFEKLVKEMKRLGAELVGSETEGPVTVLRFSTGTVVRWAAGAAVGSLAWDIAKNEMEKAAKAAPPVVEAPATFTVESPGADGAPQSTEERHECCGGPVDREADTLGHCAWCSVLPEAEPTVELPRAEEGPAPMTYDGMLAALWNDMELGLDTWEPDPAKQGDELDTVRLLERLALAGAWLADDVPSMLSEEVRHAA